MIMCLETIILHFRFERKQKCRNEVDGVTESLAASPQNHSTLKSIEELKSTPKTERHEITN